MRKKLTSVALALTALLAATSCDDDKVTLKEENGKSVIYSLNGANYSFTADDLLAELQTSSTARSNLYNEVARQVFTVLANDRNVLSQSTYDSNVSAAEKAVTKFKENCKSSAADSDKDYSEYLQDALKDLGVESTEELEELYLYQNNKEDILADFVEDNYDFFLQKYLECYAPFQVKHILIAANTSDTKFYDGTMTADNARKLITLIDRLSAGESFAQVSDLTDDTSSKDNGGVMPFNEGQNYVSEFRFAPYILEIFDNSDSAETRYAKAVKLNFFSDDEDNEDYVSFDEFKNSDLYKVYGDGIGELDWDACKAELTRRVSFEDAGAYNYYQTNSSNLVVNSPKVGVTIPTVAEQDYEMNVTKYNDEGDENKKYYEEYQLARNQAFNKYLNKHEVRYVKVNGNYLKDENGNKIYVVLASTGLHFMSTVKNPLDANVSDYYKLYDSTTTNLVDYKNTYIGRNQSYEILSKLTSNSTSLLNSTSSYVSSPEQYLFYYLVFANGTDDVFNAQVLPDYDTTSSINYRGSMTVSFFDEDANGNSEIKDILEDYLHDVLVSTDESFLCSTKGTVESYIDKIVREQEVQKNNPWAWDSSDKVEKN